MTESSPVFADGFGRRVVRRAGPDMPLTEHLVLDPLLAGHAGFTAALRERASQLQGRRMTAYARVLRIDGDHSNGLEIVSEHVPGWRLADLLDVAESENLTFDLGVVMLLLRQLLPTAAMLGTQSRDSGSGALGPEHLLLTRQARLVLTDYVLGSAIDALGWEPQRLWRTLRIATMPGTERAVTPRGDVLQVGLLVLSLIIGRRLRDDECPDRLEDLVTSARQKTPAVIHAPLSAPLRDWLMRALQLAPKGFATLFDAQMALERLLAAEPSLVAQPVELETTVARFVRFMPEVEWPKPQVVLPPPVAEPVPDLDWAPTPAPDLDFGAPLPRSTTSTKKSGIRKRATPKPADVLPQIPVDAPEPAFASVAAADAPDVPAPMDAPPHHAVEFATVPSTAPPAIETAATVARVVESEVVAPPVVPASLPTPAEAHHVLPVPPAASPWWQSSRAVAALVAVAVAQALVIAWLGSRPSEGLGGDGELVVTSQPPGAQVVIDDQAHGVTPLTVRVSPGTHVLQVRAGSAEPRIIPLQIRSGVQTAQYVELMGVATTGVLEVRSEPSKARVTVDGLDRGSTPLVMRDVAPGSYQIVLERSGWKTAQVVRVEPGATAQLVVPLR